MAKKVKTIDTVPVRAFRMHNSVCITVPLMLRRDLAIVPGDYILLSKKRGSKFAVFEKMEVKKHVE